MAIKSISDLKTEFSTGNRATSDSFGDLIDSSFNKYEESVLLGPIGLTGKYGLRGPTGATYFGSYISSTSISPSVPVSSGATGYIGQMIFSSTGGTGTLYIHNGSQWFKFTGLSEF